ncbi:MAG: hypothetical protein ABR508_10515 [Candidatus Baltobacteraceae bacterium]
MKPFICFLAFLMLFPPNGNAAGTVTPPAQMMKNALGAFTCTTGGARKHSSTFSPLFGGKAMELSEATERGFVTYDRSKNKWIYSYLGADGSYSLLEGKSVAANGIDFTSVYPSGMNTTLKVRYQSTKHFTVRFSGVVNGKAFGQTEICSRS